MRRIQLAIFAGVAAALGAIGATVWIGLSVREDTVVAHPYEDGLRQDAERHARAALGLAVSLAGRHDAGVAKLEFELRDRRGPVDDAEVDVEISRPETSRGERAARAVSLGGGRWSAALAFPDAGPWDVRFDVVRGKDRVRLERRVAVSGACDLGAGPCTRTLEDGRVLSVELSPRPVRAMRELAVRVVVRGADSRTVTISFVMPGMAMGENRSSLAATAPGTYEGKAVLVRCASGRRDWVAEVELAGPGAARRTARFPLTLPEDAR
ncbi:MAG TPA: FixH family protein [Anaeromyxobacter sp.]